MPSSIGSALGSVGSALGGLFGGGGSAAGVPAQAAEAAASALPTTASSLPASWDPSQPAPGVGFGPTTSLLPSDSVLNPAGGGGGTAPSSPFSLLTSPTDPSNPLAPLQAASMAPGGTTGTTTDPSSSPWSQILNYLQTPKGAAAGIGGLGNLVESIMRWNTMRTLSNPAALASGAQQMYQPMSAAMKRAITGPVTAAAQETGQINAPGLYAQSVGSALAPYQYAMQEKALQDYITALTASGGAYPEGGPFGAGGPSYQGGTAYGRVAA